MKYLSICSGIEAASVARWIGERIAAVDAITNETRSAE